MSLSLNPMSQPLDTGTLYADIPSKALQGAVLSMAVHVISGSAYPVALLGGALAAAATVIEAIARPIIEGTFPSNSFFPMFLTTFALLSCINDLGAVAGSKLGIHYSPTSIGSILQVFFLVFEWNQNGAVRFIR